MRRSVTLAGLAAALGLLVLVSGCKKANQYAPPPPQKVSVAKPISRKITRYLDSTGNTEAIASVDLVARVEGFLQSINYTDGAAVKAGDILFVIEPLPYQAKLNQAQAAEASAKAQLVNAQATFQRQESLQRNSVASVQNLDDARAQRDSAQANLQQAQASTQLAAINYAYTRVQAPFDGRVSAHLVSVGDLVGTSPTKLATITQMKPIHVTFNVSETEVLKIREQMRRKGLSREDITKVPVEIGLQDETGYPHAGHLDYVSPTVDPSTGTLMARAILDNEDGALLPGYFARVRVALQTDVAALLVPDSALGADQGGSYLLVVGHDNTVAEVHVKTGPLEGALRVIEAGLKPDDQVVVDGLQRATPGQTVAPVTVTLAADRRS
ncbi:MAG: efflux transporter periplasmic adaptor subunit [Rhodospirillales bacterium 20-64-7]|nr:MAG: efflux transporter periplasmic adaptor subunit [Rhodospirillales bacterium 20-64-7]HQT77625.1 efflux RND transporter periplasmic adaptor subunit [Rhodopila sp.]